MNTLDKVNSKGYPIFSWIIFGLLTIYLLLRAYFNEPIHDEVATYYHYIESGIYWGEGLVLDANNHLLNSILGRWIYLIFGDEMFFLRLPNVIAFSFYFWGIYRLIKPIKSNFHKSLILLGTTCIPYILDYFAYTRGYGISLGLFVFSLPYIRDFVATRNLKAAYWSSLLMALVVYANLTFLLTLILMGFLFVLIQWMYRKELSRKQHLFLFINYVLLGISMLPNLYHAHILKANGALYYGSLDGFWKVTGKTLAHNIIFHDLDWLKYASLAVIFAICFFLIRRWLKMGSVQFFTKTTTILAWFLFGNCVAIILMAKILKINYPEDRVGMHLAVIFLLLAGYILSQVKKLNWLLFAMLFFPITFLPRINLTTSIFSPDDRMATSFFNDVIKETSAYSSITVYPLQQLTWYYHSRKLDSVNIVNAERVFNSASDIFVTKTSLYQDQDFSKDYNVIAQNPESTHIAYQRKVPYVKTEIYNLPLNEINGNDDYIPIYQVQIPDSLRNRKLQFHFHADVTAENLAGEFLILRYTTFGKDKEPIKHQYTSGGWLHGDKKEFYLNFNYAVGQLLDEETEIAIYILNRKKENIIFKNGVFKIFELTDASK